jgi:hypothetical protein
MAPRAGSLHVLLLLAAGAGAFVVARELAQHEPPAELVEVVERSGTAVQPAGVAEPTSAPAAAATTSPVPMRPEFSAEVAEDPFQKQSWTPPPVIAAPGPPVAPPAPRAPPLPFSFVGLLEKGPGQPSAFLARGEELLVVSAGDVLDRTYRVDSMTATEIVFTYLPLSERQAIALAGGPK